MKKFEKGSGCYTCKECGKQTRETGESESNVKMCKDCYRKSQWGNFCSDNDIYRAWDIISAAYKNLGGSEGTEEQILKWLATLPKTK